LIPPPPEEKLKKWEEGKLRAQKHIESMKANNQREISNEDAMINTNTTKSQADKPPDIEGPPEVTRKNFGEAEPGLFSTPEKTKRSKDAGEKDRSPSGGESILTDQKMAEKVALASSAAAVKFEESFVQGGVSLRSPSSQESKEAAESPIAFCSPDQGEEPPETELGLGNNQSMELVGGAFSSWKPSDFEKKENLQELKQGNHREAHDVGALEPSDFETLSGVGLLSWFCKDVLDVNFVVSDSEKDISVVAHLLLEDDVNFNSMCQHVADSVNEVTSELGMASSLEELTVQSFGQLTVQSTDESTLGGKVETYMDKKRPWLKPMVLSEFSTTCTQSYCCKFRQLSLPCI
jgi:hypothetical protein